MSGMANWQQQQHHSLHQPAYRDPTGSIAAKRDKDESDVPCKMGDE